MFTVINNMIDAKYSKGRLHFQSPSNKEIGFVKYGLTFKLSSTKLLKTVPCIAKSFKRELRVEN